MFNLFKNKNAEKESLDKILAKSADFKCIEYVNNKSNISFSLKLLSTLVDEKTVQESILPYLLNENFKQIEDVKQIIPLADVELSEDISQIEQKLFNGSVLLTIKGKENKFCFLGARKEIGRNISLPEVEFSVIGPKESFVESIYRSKFKSN